MACESRMGHCSSLSVSFPQELEAGAKLDQECSKRNDEVE